MTEKVAIAGASGLVGANILKAALARGYAVNGAMRNPTGPAARLMDLPGAEDRLELMAADMAVEGAFDPVMQGVDGVFIACLVPVYFAPDGTPARELDDTRGRAEIIQPTVDGCLNIMRSAIRSGVRDIVICSSTSSTNPVPAVPVKNEVDHWSDPDQQCADRKFTSAAKASMERAAMALAAEHGVRLRIFAADPDAGPDGSSRTWRGRFHGRPQTHAAWRDGTARKNAK